jgi:pyridinium-3,5-bisthiocarboxylic acid mononucleotide nickel chelatase
MKIAYFDCPSGISGDMTLGALLDVGLPLDVLNDAIRSLGLPGCFVKMETVHKCGFRATQALVEYAPEHVHRHLSDILAMIDQSDLTAHAKETSTAVFQRLGEVEATVHGVSIEKVHFHEVGAADSIADIVGVCVGLDWFGIEQLIASPVPTGTGTIKIAHGTCGIPAPATAELLRGIPLAESTIPKELTTPTGAALLSTLADSFGPVPAMKIQGIGCGAGQRDIETQPNILRLILGESTEATETVDTLSPDFESHGNAVWIAETNLDDATGEMVGHCIERLWETPVLDVWTTAIQMKKQRPGICLHVLCLEDDLEQIEQILFRETTTLGIRRWPVDRSILERRTQDVETKWGTVRGKVAVLPDGQERFSPEADDCREIARRENIAWADVYAAARATFGTK